MLRLLSSPIRSIFLRALIALLKVDKTPITISPKYFDFVDVFSTKQEVELPKHTEIKVHIINLVNGKQLCFRPIYSLVPVELETFKTYIKINLANSFMRPSKSLISTPILFVWKSN